MDKLIAVAVDFSFRAYVFTSSGTGGPEAFLPANPKRVGLLVSSYAGTGIDLCLSESVDAGDRINLPAGRYIQLKIADFGPLIQGAITAFSVTSGNVATAYEVYKVN